MGYKWTRTSSPGYVGTPCCIITVTWDVWVVWAPFSCINIIVAIKSDSCDMYQFGLYCRSNEESFLWGTICVIRLSEICLKLPADDCMTSTSSDIHHTRRPPHMWMSGVVDVLFYTLCGGCLAWWMSSMVNVIQSCKPLLEHGNVRIQIIFTQLKACSSWGKCSKTPVTEKFR